MAWPVVCGSAVAERTQAVTFEDGILHVAVPDVGWRSELQTLAPRYLATINKYTSEMVRRIEFVVTRPENDGKNIR
jgi:Dna[CI] antecedent, DciA